MKHFGSSILIAVCLACSLVSLSAGANYICGNGVVESGEACDDGSYNSDSRPNGCRTDCRAAYCGDGVIDNGEACDDGGANSDHSPAACRRNCTMPRCGDGVVDVGEHRRPPVSYSEECDDANDNEEDGCLKTCRSCIDLSKSGNILVTQNTHVCAGSFKLDDYGDYGAVTIKHNGVTLDCHGAFITGEGRGVGVMIVRSKNVTIRNCNIFGYESGIKGEDSNGVRLYSNRICGNDLDIDFPDVSGAVGRGNACRRAGTWSEGGKNGCTQKLQACNPPTKQAPDMSGKPPATMKPLSPARIKAQVAPTRKLVKPVQKTRKTEKEERDSGGR